MANDNQFGNKPLNQQGERSSQTINPSDAAKKQQRQEGQKGSMGSDMDVTRNRSEEI